MPIAEIKMLEGRNEECKKSLIRAVTRAIQHTLGVKPDAIRVIINEIPAEHYGIAGLPYRDFKQRNDGKKKHS